jgi:glycosyltransferase involved in cell wall biosynthesis
LRIVFVLVEASLAGGVRTVATYARLLSRRGHRVTIVSTPAEVPPLPQRLRSFLRGRGWPRPLPPGPSHLDGLDVEHRKLRRHRPLTDRDVPDADVIVATWWRTAEWIALLSPRKGAKAHFIQGHDVETPGQPSDRYQATWRLPLHRIVCSRWLLGLARDRYGDASASCVPNGVDLEQFDVPPRVKQERPTVGMVYAPEHMKGCDVAVAAFALASRRVAGLRLVSFGSYPVSSAVPLPPDSEFTWRPDQRVIPRIYGRCDAWLWPSRREGFGLPILEAMACRTPVIAAPAGAAPELLSQGGGVLLPAPEPEPMAEAIERICSLSEGEWRALSDRARAVATQHGWDESVRLFEAALEVAIQRGAGSLATPRTPPAGRVA